MSESMEEKKPKRSLRERIQGAGETIDTIRTVGGRFEHFPPEEIPERMLETGQHVVKQAAPLVVAAGITAGIVNPIRAAEAPRPAAVEVERSTEQLKLDTMLGDIAAQTNYTIRDVNELTPDDITCLARNVFNEARGETFEGQLATVFVVLARAKDRRFPNTPCRVVYQPTQFSWTFDKKILEKQDSPEAQRGVAEIRAAIEALIGGNKIDEAIALLGSLLSLPETTIFYKRADWDEKNPLENRMSDKSKKQWQERVAVRQIGRHVFYRERTREEALAESQRVRN